MAYFQENNEYSVVSLPKIRKKEKWSRCFRFAMDFVTMAAAIGSVLAAAATLMTVSEMKADRSSSVRPDIHFNAQELIFEERAGKLPLMKDGEETVSLYINEGMLDPAFALELDMCNVGAGSAKNITISVTEEASLESINEFNERSVYCDIHTEPNQYYGNAIMYTITKDGTVYPLGEGSGGIRLENIQKISYLRSENEMRYRLPPVVHALIHAQLLEDQMGGRFRSRESTIIPDVEMHVDFTDILGDVHEKKLFIRIEPGFLWLSQFSVNISVISEMAAQQEIGTYRRVYEQFEMAPTIALPWE